MSKIEVSFAIGDKVVDSVDVTPITFAQFSEYVTTAQGMKSPSTFEGRLRRVRMLRQVSYIMAGKPVVITPDELTKMPLIAARTIAENLDSSEAAPGKVIREGDGISTAIGYELGSPIAVAQGKEPIKEIEFLASTYGDIEDVLAANDPMSQTMALLRTVAKPVHTSLTSLPSWAVDRISIADGIFIAQNVTNRFLGDL